MLTFHITPAIKTERKTQIQWCSEQIAPMDIRRARHTHAHHTRLRFHKNIAQPHQTKDNNRMCAVTGMAPVLDVEISPTQNQHQSQTCVQHGEQRTTKPSCSRESSPRVPDALKTGVRDLAPSNKDEHGPLATNAVVAQPQRKNAETVAELSRGTDHDPVQP